MSVRRGALGAACLKALLVLSACTSSRGSEELAVWTKALADNQRDGPELILFERGDRRLAFIGVQHDSDPASRTHRLIDSTFLIFKPRVVIVEGAPTSWGYSPRRLIEVGGQRPDAQGLLPEGETVPTVRGALAAGSIIVGGEPSDADVRRIAATRGVSDEDLLGFYVLRVVPQWLSQREFDDLSSTRDRPGRQPACSKSSRAEAQPRPPAGRRGVAPLATRAQRWSKPRSHRYRGSRTAC